ncbi:hypothetical protein IJZ97_03435, partial [bacterium]|nr:hypothetical protein [bacterium]
GSTDGRKGSVSLGTTALAILYDTNGYKSPNKSAKDLRSINVTKLGSGCFAEANGVCLASAPFAPTPVTKAECEAMISTHGIQACEYDEDYWAGAVKACGGTSKMAKESDLTKIANYVYNRTDISTGYIDGLTYDSTKATEIGLPSSASFFVWSGEEDVGNYAYTRIFSSDFTEWSNGYRYFSGGLVVCLGD